jgi:hypothetical protein
MVSKIVGILSAIGRIVGVVGKTTAGTKVKARLTRLAVSFIALLTAFFVWLGVPEPLAEPLARFLVEVANTITQ